MLDGLSALRAQRAKSRGPKGLQLEVGARKAPRLLVHNKEFDDNNVDDEDEEDEDEEDAVVRKAGWEASASN